MAIYLVRQIPESRGYIRHSKCRINKELSFVMHVRSTLHSSTVFATSVELSVECSAG
jgi:hypothetical protein